MVSGYRWLPWFVWASYLTYHATWTTKLWRDLTVQWWLLALTFETTALFNSSMPVCSTISSSTVYPSFSLPPWPTVTWLLPVLPPSNILCGSVAAKRCLGPFRPYFSHAWSLPCLLLPSNLEYLVASLVNIESFHCFNSIQSLLWQITVLMYFAFTSFIKPLSTNWSIIALFVSWWLQ